MARPVNGSQFPQHTLCLSGDNKTKPGCFSRQAYQRLLYIGFVGSCFGWGARKGPAQMNMRAIVTGSSGASRGWLFFLLRDTCVDGCICNFRCACPAIRLKVRRIADSRSRNLARKSFEMAFLATRNLARKRTEKGGCAPYKPNVCAGTLEQALAFRRPS